MLAAALLAVGCGRVYTPTSARVARTQDAELQITHLDVVDGAPALAQSPENLVGIAGRTTLERGSSLAFARIAPSDAPPCTSGVEPSSEAQASGVASAHDDPASKPERHIYWTMPRYGIDLTRPTSLDVSVVHADGSPPGCLRVPLVEATGSAEWAQEPVYTLGVGFGVTVPFRAIYGAKAMPTFALRGGAWLGPVRLRIQGLVGGAIADATNANLIAYSYGGGLLVDSLAWSWRRLGLGIAAGYDVMGISYGANIDALSHDGAGFQGGMHGPRAGLLLTLLPPPPPGPAFRARTDALSASLELYGAALWSADRPTATPAMWVALLIDGGL
jgi:hypothetical protein